MKYMHHGSTGKWFVARIYTDDERQLYVELEITSNSPEVGEPLIDDEDMKLVFRSTEQVEDLANVLGNARDALKKLTDARYSFAEAGIARLLSNRYL